MILDIFQLQGITFQLETGKVHCVIKYLLVTRCFFTKRKYVAEKLVPTIWRELDNAVLGSCHTHTLAHRVHPVTGQDGVWALSHKAILLVEIHLQHNNEEKSWKSSSFFMISCSFEKSLNDVCTFNY